MNCLTWKDSREWPIIVLKLSPFLKITQFLIIDHLLQLYTDHLFDQNYYWGEAAGQKLFIVITCCQQTLMQTARKAAQINSIKVRKNPFYEPATAEQTGQTYLR